MCARCARLGLAHVLVNSIHALFIMIRYVVRWVDSHDVVMRLWAGAEVCATDVLVWSLAFVLVNSIHTVFLIIRFVLLPNVGLLNNDAVKIFAIIFLYLRFHLVSARLYLSGQLLCVYLANKSNYK